MVDRESGRGVQGREDEVYQALASLTRRYQIAYRYSMKTAQSGLLRIPDIIAVHEKDEGLLAALPRPYMTSNHEGP